MTSTREERPPRLIARELALGFGTISLVAVLTSGVLLGLLDQVSGLVMGMRTEEDALRQGLGLATAVREDYIHMAHALIEGDTNHLEHGAEWRRRVSEGLEALAPNVPEAERWRVAKLQQATDELAARFDTTALPAALRGDRETAVDEHRVMADLVADASAQADALARAVEQRMSKSHLQATRATRLGLLGGGVGALLILGLGVAFTLRLQRAVLKPLNVLAAAARSFGAGDFEARVGDVGHGELLAVAQAFDRMAEELAERQRRLVHTERMAAIGHLAAGVAHELNNPIGIIRGYLKTMSAKDDPATLDEELAILDEEAGHCQRIAEDLLSYARPQALRYGPLEMRPFLEETVSRFRETSSGREAQVTVDATDATLSGDATRLRQVVHNLVLNAVQVSPPGEPVAVTGRPVQGSYVIEVADRGPGVPAEEQDRIFEPFYSKRRGGSGLGLAVCQGIARAHGGTVQVTSIPGRGATFRVTLPPAPPTAEGGAA